MKRNTLLSDTSESLRIKAEEILKNRVSENTPFVSEAELLKLVHEFDVNQIELELQNKELNNAIAETNDAVDLYDFAPIGYFTLSKTGSINRLNLKGAEMLGRERSCLENFLFAFYISSDTRSIFDLFLHDVFTKLTPQSCEVTLALDNNPPVFVQITGIAAGNGEQCLITATDITLRRQAEIAITQSEERYRYMFANNPEPMWIFDVETFAFLEVNQAAVVQYGYSVEEFLSMTLMDIRPAEDATELLKNFIPNDNTYYQAGEFRHSKKNGEIIDVLITWHSVIFKGRKARHVLVKNITKQKQAEHELEKQNALLAKITQFSIDLATLPATENFEAFIAIQIKELTGASVVAYSEYDSVERMITPRYIDLEPGMLQKVVSLLGNKVQSV